MADLGVGNLRLITNNPQSYAVPAMSAAEA